MNLKTVKTLSDIPFAGIQLVRVDKNITEVIVGGKLRIRSGPSYSNSLEVLVDAPFETVTRHRLTAVIEGFDPKVSYHDSDYEAKSAGAKLEDKGATITVDKVEVRVNDAGEVVGEDAAAPAPSTMDDIPF